VEQELVHKSMTAESDISGVKSASEMTNMNFQLMQRRMNDIPSRVNERKSNLWSIFESGGDY
jgi:hypothetical protein